MNFAWNHFGQIAHGLPRVQAICDWVHNNIEYRFGSGRPDLSASEVIERRHGVCRDFAHAAIALCRAFNLPARYVTGHLPDIGYVDPGTPMAARKAVRRFVNLVGRVSSRALILPWNRCREKNQGSTESRPTLDLPITQVLGTDVIY